MKVHIVLHLILLIQRDAHAVLSQTQQGRLLDASGAAVSGYNDMTFRIYDDLSAGLLLWGRERTAESSKWLLRCCAGFDEVNNPLDESVLSLYPLS